MKNPSIVFLGYGTIGKHEYKKLEKLKPDIYDPSLGYTLRKLPKEEYDFAFVCVPTPTVDGKCDTSIVEDAILSVDAKIYVVKSTVIPTTCERIANLTGKHIVFSQENYGATQHASNFEYNFTILGGNKEDCLQVQQLLQEVYDARHIFRIVDFRTAELSKYMLNSFLAMKVNFCNAFWEISNSLNISYEELRECFVLDPRINPAHTFVYNDRPFWDSHCFNKDVPAIANFSHNPLLKAVDEYNTYLKERYKNED